MFSQTKKLLGALAAVTLTLVIVTGTALAQVAPPANESDDAQSTNTSCLVQMQETMGTEAWGLMIQRMTQMHGAEATGEMLQWMNEIEDCPGDHSGPMMGGMWGSSADSGDTIPGYGLGMWRGRGGMGHGMMGGMWAGPSDDNDRSLDRGFGMWNGRGGMGRGMMGRLWTWPSAGDGTTPGHGAEWWNRGYLGGMLRGMWNHWWDNSDTAPAYGPGMMQRYGQ